MKKHIAVLSQIITEKLVDGRYKAQAKDTSIWDVGNSPYEAVGKLIYSLETWHDQQTPKSQA